MNKFSVRKQIEKLREDFNAHIEEGSIPPKVRKTINSLFILLDLIVAAFLEKKTRKNSSNSGLPPSQDFGSNGNRNKKDGQNKDQKKPARCNNIRDVQSSETISPKECASCGANLKHAKVVDTESRKQFDIVYEIQEHTVTSEVKKCPDCGQENIAEFPKGMDGPLQYGTGIKTDIINSLVHQMIPIKRVQDHFTSLIGREISPDTMLKYVSNLSKSLKPWEEEAIQEILKSDVIYVDETSMRVKKKKFWIHTYSSKDLVVQFLRPSRGREAMNDIGILEKYKGVIVHDCYAPYFTYKHLTHGLCMAHLLRELKFVEESTGDRWATNLKKLLQETNKSVERRKKSRVLTKKEYKRLQKRYRNILTRALSELPDFPKNNGGKPGRPKRTYAQNLWRRLKKYESEVFLFTRMKVVESTNNRAERDLRMNKVKRKVSGCFRNEKMGHHYCRVTSYLKTMKNNDYFSLEAITMALKGEIPKRE